MHPTTDDRLLVGLHTGDDAAVWKIDERTALVFTTDFFTPIVDDPYDWGRIAAANAFSDVYAMGGTPILALNITAWPAEVLPLEMLARVLEGGADVAASAGAVVAGGHTIDDQEPKYGMAVAGLVSPDRIITNAAGKPGDCLLLTKPIGTGVIATAIKREVADEATIARAVEVMTALNRGAAEAMIACGVKAATDVTGFGLLGHLHRMLLASGCAAVIDALAVPMIERAQEFAEAGFVPGGTVRNRDYVDPYVRWTGVEEIRRVLLCDAQTSGGMLICAPPQITQELRAALDSQGCLSAEIGRLVAGPAGAVGVFDGVAPSSVDW